MALCKPVETDQECRALPTVYKATQSIAMLNLSEKTKVIPQGTQIAKVTLLRRQLQTEEPELPTLLENEGISELFEIDKNQLLDQNQKQQLKTLIYQYCDVWQLLKDSKYA